MDNRLPRVYFDNAATSWPKPPGVPEAVADWLMNVGGSPGRSGHAMSVASSRMVEKVRDDLAELFDFPDPLSVIFAKNATEALNTAIFSLVPPGGRVVTSAGEHNSLMRPLRHLERTAGVRLVKAAPDEHGRWTVDSILAEVDAGTSLVAVGHASNVSGLLMPVEDLWEALAGMDIPLLIDGAQTAGALPISLRYAARTAYAFTGHKALLGPPGTGGLLIGGEVWIQPRLFGGTGSKSDSDLQPEGLPDSIESGTLNACGIAGLGAGVSYLSRTGLAEIRKHEVNLLRRFLESARQRVDGIRIFGTLQAEDYLSTVSFNLPNLTPSQTGMLLDRKYGVMCRVGLHCNPNCHQALGTYPTGTVRFSFSPFTSEAEIDYAVEALAEMARLA